MSQDENKKRRDLYRQGLSDREIAEECNVATQSIFKWRKSRNLESKIEGRLPRKEEQKRLELYKQGLKDKEIAKKCGVTAPAIHKWRKNRDLKPNAKEERKLPKEEEEKRLKLYKQGSKDREIAEKCFVSRESIRYWRHSRGLKANYKQRNPEK